MSPVDQGVDFMRRTFRSQFSGWALASLFAFLLTPSCTAQFADPALSSSSALSIPRADVLQPEELRPLLQSNDKPIVLQVGSRIMFAQAHIPGAQYAGPGSQPMGLQLIESKVAASSKSKAIVIYCGCCPWNRCPNVGPAYKKLRELGFTNVKVLSIPNNFGDDWVNKGYAVEKGGE
jgi:thiosulfate/3-mercaptopyruvate sulfurtransferase